MKVKWSLWSILLVSYALAAWSGSSWEPPGGSHTADVLARGKLTMLCFPLQDSRFVRPKIEVLRQRGVPLTELRDADAYAGSDVELVRAFADALGVTLEMRPITTTYRQLIDAVVTHRGDLAASSLTVTAEREKIIDFSAPIGGVWAVVATRLDEPMLSLEELAGRPVRGNAGASQVEIFRQMGPEDAEIVLGDYTLENYTAVVDGDADFLLMDSDAEIGEPASEEYPQVKVMLRLKKTEYGVAFPEGSDLKARFDEFLARRGADREAP